MNNRWVLIIFFFLILIIILVFYLIKPQNIVRTVEKVVEREVSSCMNQSYNGRHMCEAAEACKQQGGRLKSFKDTFGNAPEIECEYE